MKKNRPGTMLSAIIPLKLQTEAVALVIKETSTLGVRIRQISRYEADRESVEIMTTYGMVKVKVKRVAGKVVSVSPEYEVCRQIALDKKLSLQNVYQQVEAEATRKIRD